MKILIDTSPLKNANSVRGVGFYTKRLVAALQQYQSEHQYLLKDHPDDHQTPGEKVDLIHYPYFDPFFLTLPIRKQIPIIVTIHDVIPLVFPHLFPKGIKGWIKLQLQKAKLQLVDAVITDSYSSKNDIAKYLSYPKKKIHVVHLAVEEIYKRVTDQAALDTIKAKYNLPRRYLLKVGDINPTKNFETTLNALSKYPEAHLVLVGKALVADREANPVISELQQILQLIEQNNLHHRVHRLGFVPDQDMPALYTLAAATLQNSLYEGFGLPALESIACGTPVITSQCSSLPEVVGEAGIMVNPLSEDELVSSIQQIYEADQNAYTALIQKSQQQATNFSMRKMAQETYNIYASVNQSNKTAQR